MSSLLRSLAERLVLSRTERRMLAWLREGDEADTGTTARPASEPREKEGREDDDPPWFGHAGIDLREEEQLALLEELEAPVYQALFRRLRADPRLAGSGAEDGSSDLIRNGYFPSPDAELYAALIVRERPRRIVEVGAGFSTLVARSALEHAGASCELHVVDPRPRVAVDDVADRVERSPVERSTLARRTAGGDGIRLGPDTLLFIDSSHRTRGGGDGPFLYCDLIPSLPSGVLVHVHDIYIPWDYPRVYRERVYTEQYLLHALLAHSRRLDVICAPYFLSRSHPESMRRAFGPAVAGPRAFQGASLWMRVR